MLRKTATKNEKDWHKLISHILFTYREVLQESTGFSPSELLYARNVRGPLDMLSQITDLNKKSEPNNINWTTECDAAFKKQERMMTSLFFK